MTSKVPFRFPAIRVAVVLALVSGGIPSACFAAEEAPAGFIASALGVTRRDTPIPCWVSREDFKLDSRKTRILLIGASKPSAAAISETLQWFSKHDDAARWRERFLLSAAPNLNPDNRRAQNAAHPLRGYPPKGDSYQSRENPEAQYAWRWIGMHAPDLVVTIERGSAESMAVLPLKGSELERVAAGIDERIQASPAADSLARALVEHKACEVGRIEAIELKLGETSPPIAIRKLLERLSAAGFQGPSEARRELQRRVDRTPLEVAQQLSRHYGKHLRQVVYIPAVALIARLRMGALGDDPRQLRIVRDIVDARMKNATDEAPKSGSGLSGHLIFTELATRVEGRDRERYLKFATRAADLGVDENGVPRDHLPYHHEMSDSLFMGGPILAAVGRLKKDPRYFEACLNHLRFLRGLDLRKDNLYRHSPLDETAWGRGNGFPALGLAMCLDSLPKGPRQKEVLGYFRSHLRALKRLQDPNGCWHQIVDHPESYRELTSTCMITYAMARGIRRGWLDRKVFEPSVRRAWRAILTRTPANGRLVDVCTGTGKQKTQRDYFDRKAILGPDDRGGAMAMLVATEMAAWAQDE